MLNHINPMQGVTVLCIAAACFGYACEKGHSVASSPATTSNDTGGGGGADGNGGASAVSTAGTAGMTTACAYLSIGATTQGGMASCSATALPANFTWTSSGPLIAPKADDTHPIVSVKDPTVVFFNGKWHVYATTANTLGAWNMVYLSFNDWSEAATAMPYYLDNNPNLKGYHCAPQLFYFTPQKKWYLVYQSGPPQFSTADDPSRPETWSLPKSFFASEPAIVKANKGSGTWLDFWVICDETNCHMFFSDDNGHYYRSQTTVSDFPNGFGEPVMVLKDTKANLFEASNVYKLKGTDKYLALIEAFGPNGHRYFRSWTADRLDGDWTPLADTWENPFAGTTNIEFDKCASAWTADISHGELLRDGYDETLTVNPCNLTFLYQGTPDLTADYSQIPWTLGLLTQK